MAKMSPDDEVINGLGAKAIDVTKEWVKNLCKRVSSLQELTRLRLQELEDCCRGADEREMKKVYQLVEEAESTKNLLAAIPNDDKLIQQTMETKAADLKTLKNAKELLNEAKAIAKDQSESSKKTLNETLALIMSTLELPIDWLREDEVKPAVLFQYLDKIIKQCTDVLESADAYKSEVEIVTRASAGRALCGIYYSKYESPKPAGIPLLLVPMTVTLNSPNSAQEVNYMKFSAKGIATDYVRTVESTSTNIGFGVVGFEELLVGEVQNENSHEDNSLVSQSAKTTSTSASALQYIRIAKKVFQIEPHQLRLSLTAEKKAKSIVQDRNPRALECEKSARIFMERYGSHFPAGLQTLGGVFFNIADAESKSTTDIFKLTEAAVAFLGGALRIGVSGTEEYTNSGENSEETNTAIQNEKFSHSVRSIGPPATNPATFQKLLSYSSTWALIDRGPSTSYIPIWDLIEDLGSEFREVATALKETWHKDEDLRQEKWEAEQNQLKKREEIEQRSKERILAEAREELLRIREEHLAEREPGLWEG
ncbi:interferon-induced very large GTPase 1-like [Porites lutea]